MPHPYLAFCPYLPLTAPIEFAGWRVGPVASFNGRWTDEQFRDRGLAFLAKFVDAEANQLDAPALVGRVGQALDGQLPSAQECEALQAALDFGFLDGNPRYSKETDRQGWVVTTSDNTEVFIWPIDIEGGGVTLARGTVVQNTVGALRIDDPKWQIRSPLELHLPATPSADTECLTAIYDVYLGSLRAPGVNPVADRVRTAVRWLAKAWRNSHSIDWEDRVVFLKTAFEALTGTSNSRESARRLRVLFESLQGVEAGDAEQLMWSPTEQPVHPRTYKDPQTKQAVTEHLTDLEQWFMAFATARNRIVHDGVVPRPLAYSQAGGVYEGPYFHTAEFVLRAAVKASVESLGHHHLWRSSSWRAAVRAVEEWNRQQHDVPVSAPSDETGDRAESHDGPSVNIDDR